MQDEATQLLFIIYQGANIKSTHSNRLSLGFLVLAFD